MVDLFLKRGFTYFDTAWFYHQGTSEGVVRQALVEPLSPGQLHPGGQDAPVLPEGQDRRRPGGDLPHQLERCGVDYFDYYLLHNVNAESYETALALDTFSYLLGQKGQGRIRHLGFSFHDSAKVLDRVLTEHPEVSLSSSSSTIWTGRAPASSPACATRL